MMRKGPGKEARRSYAAEAVLNRQPRKGVRPRSLAGDKGYHTRHFIQRLRDRGIAPHIAQIEGRSTAGLDARTTRHPSYQISQRKRKRIEEIFGWLTFAGAAYNLLRMSRLQISTA